MKKLYTVIKKPLFTEKGANLKETKNKLLIEVFKDANKIEIKKAFEENFNVKVENVAIINTRGKWKRQGRFIGKTSARKKAIITLKKGEKLDFIEGV